MNDKQDSGLMMLAATATASEAAQQQQQQQQQHEGRRGVEDEKQIQQVKNVIDVVSSEYKQQNERIMDHQPSLPPPPPGNLIISRQVKKDILRHDVCWPICSYHQQSKRMRKSAIESTTMTTTANATTTDINASSSSSYYKDICRLKQIFDQLDGWERFKEISIDGMNGTGKTSICSTMLNRVYCKINEHPAMNNGVRKENRQQQVSITAGSDYNYKPINFIEYIMLQCLTRIKTEDLGGSNGGGGGNSKNDNGNIGIVWDRSPYSNLVFYLVHQLIAVYKTAPIPADPSTVYPLLNDFALTINLSSIINYTRAVKQLPILILINSDIELVSLAMLQRGGLNDITNAKEYNYQRAQEHCFRYIGRILNAVVVDVAEIINLSNRIGCGGGTNGGECLMTLGDVQEELVKRIDYRRNATGGDGGCTNNDGLSRILPEGLSFLLSNKHKTSSRHRRHRNSSILHDLLIYPNRESANLVAEYNKLTNDVLIHNHSLK